MTKIKGKVRVCVDFKNVEEAIEWFDAVRKDGHVPEDADVFKQDGIDKEAAAKVSEANTFLVRRINDRPFGFAVRNANGKKKAVPSKKAPAKKLAKAK